MENKKVIKMNRYKIVQLGESEEEYFIDTEQETIDYDDYLEIGGMATMSNKQVLNILNENEKLKKVIDLMGYQLKVQDRIIKEYEDGESNEL